MMWTRITTSLCYILFSTSRVSADHAPACAASDKSACAPSESLTKALEGEDAGQGLELLQFRGSRVSRRTCPVPGIDDAQAFTSVGKGCPTPGKVGQEWGISCLDQNYGYLNMDEAWNKCGSLDDCGSVMQYSDGRFYLRRTSDPDQPDMANVKLFHYACQFSEDRQAAEHLTDKVQDAFQAITEVGQGEMQETKEMPSEIERVKSTFEEKIKDADRKASEAAQAKQELEETMREVIAGVSAAVRKLHTMNEVEKEDEDLLKNAAEKLNAGNQPDTAQLKEEEALRARREQEQMKSRAEELQKQKEEAITNEDFEAAAKAKRELDEVNAQLEKLAESKPEAKSEILLEEAASEREKCPVPDAEDKGAFSIVGKGCPQPAKEAGQEAYGMTCLDMNSAHASLLEAWDKCGEIEGCGAVLQYTDGLFYLRRTSDPDTDMPGMKLFRYACQMGEDRMAAQHLTEQVQNAFHDITELGSDEMQEAQEMPSEIERVKATFDQKIKDAQAKADVASQKKDELEQTMKEVIHSVTTAVKKLHSANVIEKGDEEDLLSAEARLMKGHANSTNATGETLLQESRVSTKICPAPNAADEKAFTLTAKGCPHTGKAQNCIDGNKAYKSLSEAWEKCGQTESCGAVMAYPDGLFYLRRTSDPDIEQVQNSKMYHYTCTVTEDRNEAEHLTQEVQDAFHQITKVGADEMQTTKEMPSQLDNLQDTFQKKIDVAKSKAKDADESKAKLENTLKEVIKSVAAAVKQLHAQNEREKADETNLLKAASHLTGNSTEGEGKSLLQESSEICPLPDTMDTKSFSSMTKGCFSPKAAHLSTKSCLHGNVPFHTMSEAWKECGKLEECGAVMAYTDGLFYLRRSSDPDRGEQAGVKLFSYSCQKKEDRMEAKHLTETVQDAFHQITKVGADEMQETHEMPSTLDAIKKKFVKKIDEAKTKASAAEETKKQLEETMKQVIHSVTKAVKQLHMDNEAEKEHENKLLKAAAHLDDNTTELVQLEDDGLEQEEEAR